MCGVVLPKVQIVLALDNGHIAVCSVGKVPAHDEHLRIFNDITGEGAMRRPRTRFVRIPFDPFKGRHGEHVYVVEPLTYSEYKSPRARMLTVAFSPKPNPPYM